MATFIGTDGDDTILAGDGHDSIDGGAGDDMIELANGEFATGMSINGGTDSGTLDRDLICLRNATTVDFTTGTISGVETLTGSFDYGIDDVTINGNDTVTISASQWTEFSNSIDLKSGTDVLNVKASGDISKLGVPAIIDNVETGNLIGTTGNDTVALAAHNSTPSSSATARSISARLSAITIRST